jgi:hypothetical protein
MRYSCRYLVSMRNDGLVVNFVGKDEEACMKDLERDGADND